MDRESTASRKTTGQVVVETPSAPVASIADAQQVQAAVSPLSAPLGVGEGLTRGADIPAEASSAPLGDGTLLASTRSSAGTEPAAASTTESDRQDIDIDIGDQSLNLRDLSSADARRLAELISRQTGRRIEELFG